MAAQIVNEAALVNNESGNVNLNIQGNVIIVAGGGEESSKYVAQGARPKQATENETSTPKTGGSSPRKNHKDFCKVVNENTKRMTSVKITEDIGSVNLNEPDFKVYPQMRKVKGYFEGNYEEWKDNEFETKGKGFFGKTKNKLLKNQIRKEVGFQFNNKKNEDEPISVEKFVNSITMKQIKSQVGITAVVASAGSGKSTLLRRIARECCDICEMFEPENESTCQNQFNRLKMVHYIEMKNIQQQDNLKPSQFLFGGLFKTEAEEDETYHWLQDRQSEAILFLDGLDQATWTVKSSHRKIQPFGKANTTEIMYNILSRNILPRVKIVLASREFKISELPADARPKEMVSLAGLKRSDAERLFKSLLGDRGDDIWINIEKMSPRLLNLISVPVFLLLTAVVMVKDPKNRPPVTITELYNKILLSLRRVDTIQEREQIMEVINKLKALAHQGMVEGRVVFYDVDLTKFNLSTQDVRDLMIKVPGSNLLSRYLLEGDFVFFFCHQSLQEFLSASFVAEMKIFKFIGFSSRHLYENRWSVVRTFLSGIIHDDCATELHKVTDVNWKQKMFSRVVNSLIQTERNALEVLATVYESNNDNLIQSIPRIPSLAEIKLTPDEAHMLGSVLGRRSKSIKEKRVELRGCRLNDDQMTVMIKSMNGRKPEVEYLDVVRNRCRPKVVNLLLKNMKVDQIRIGYYYLKLYRYEDFAWDNIKTITFKHWESRKNLHITNDSGRLRIGGILEGHFVTSQDIPDSEKCLFLHNVKDSSLEGTIDLVTFFCNFVIDLTFDTSIFTKPSDLVRLKTPNLKGQISRILLDCRSERNVDSSLIALCVKKFQVAFLDIIVNSDTSFVPTDCLKTIGSSIDAEFKLHWWFKVQSTDDVTNIIYIADKNEVDNIRLHIVRGVSFDNISTFIKSCNVKELTLDYESEFTPLRKKHETIVRLGKSHGIKVKSMTDCAEDRAWKEADARYWK